MEWENWLDKKVLDHGKQRKTDDFADPDKSLLLDTEPDKTIPQIKRDFDDETHEDPYSNKNDVNKILGAIAGAVGGAAKVIGGAVKEVASNPVVQSAALNAGNEVDNVVEDVKNESQTGVSKAWESWLEKGIYQVSENCTNCGKKMSEKLGNIKDIKSTTGLNTRQCTNCSKKEKLEENKHDIWSKLQDPKVQEDREKLRLSRNKTKNTVLELFLEKNNGIETDHKNDKKEEWDGKFSSSTIRDDAENDDDKAIGEEESLEELTDGKLEEVEKLKAWQIFLDKMGEGGTSHATSIIPTEQEKEKRIFNKNPPKNVKGHFANSIEEKPPIKGTKIIQTDRKGTFQDTKNTKNLTENDVTAGAVRTAKKHPELKQFIPEAQVEEDKGLGGDTETPVKTQEELDKEFYERTQPEPKGTKSDKKVLARRKRKSWELWLEKGVTHEDPTKGVKGGMTKVPITQAETPDEIMEAANNPKTTIKLDADMKKKKSWEEWVEKMQGAGDARYGNQHLTGMEQHPVADDESMELSAETDENNEKQEEKEDKGDKDNKPYKALSQE